MKTRTKKKQTEEANSPCGFVVPDRDRKYFMSGVQIQLGKAQEQQEISLRKWCVEQARVSGEVDVRMAQEIYDWVTGKACNNPVSTNEHSNVKVGGGIPAKVDFGFDLDKLDKLLKDADFIRAHFGRL